MLHCDKSMMEPTCCNTVPGLSERAGWRLRSGVAAHSVDGTPRHRHSTERGLQDLHDGPSDPLGDMDLLDVINPSTIDSSFCPLPELHPHLRPRPSPPPFPPPHLFSNPSYCAKPTQKLGPCLAAREELQRLSHRTSQRRC